MDDESTFNGMSRRQLLQRAGIATAAAGAATAFSSSAEAAEPMPSFRPRGRLTRRPNFLVIMIDEQRQAVPFESRALGLWRKQALHGQNALMENGLAFTNHHVMATACAPSRASFWTGQYPSLHGVTQTTGAAKSALEEDTYWLTPWTVPTMGNYFRAAGYDTWYRGKWHVSDADLYLPGTNSPIPSYNDNGVPDPELEKLYEDANRLDAFGFNGWIGPEPHGSNPYDSGSSAPGMRGRDTGYARQSMATIKRLARSRKPWLMVTSFVNPHDITLWGELTLLSLQYDLRQQIRRSSVPEELFLDSMWHKLVNEDLSSKPSAQTSYRNTYASAFQPTLNSHEYHQFYYAMQETVDKNVHNVLRALTSDPRAYRDTVVIYVSDHGDVLGSHGGLYQKWHNAYDSVLRVPFVVHNPNLFPRGETTDVLTSHADVLPTMLGIAGLDPKELQRRLARTHDVVKPLVGRDLSEYILGEKPAASVHGPVYFMTDDEPTRGDYQVDPQGNYYKAVAQPNHVEAVIAQLQTGPGGTLEQWKYARYFDNDEFWSSPGKADIVTNIEGSSRKPGTSPAVTTVKLHVKTPATITPPDDEFELYNMTLDPLEMDNLESNVRYAPVRLVMERLLQEQRAYKRISDADSERARDLGLGNQGAVPPRAMPSEIIAALTSV